MKQDSSRDIEHGRGSGAPTEALAESRTSLSEWQTDPELKFYGRAMSSRRPADRVLDARSPLDLLGGRHHALPVARTNAR